ncbi:MAG: endonuclease domain-containing protein [Proteobacteria bacterium]|nr:endonuclease domain-containing protein [Pseudomonadota bacterium]
MPKYRVQEFKRSQAKALRQSSTDAEVRLWRILRSRQLNHIKFRRQAPIGPWIVDFVAFENRLIVEADGSQHAQSHHDKVRDRDLQERGFRILRFWNNDILLSTNGVLEAILTAFDKAPSPGALRAPPSPTRGEG